jgi:hypothetical protein
VGWFHHKEPNHQSQALFASHILNWVTIILINRLRVENIYDDSWVV